METKRICLDDEEAKYRLEFMDKSIMGITDWKAAKSAEEMFKGHWENTNEERTYNGKTYPVKKFVIDDCDREKYIERSMLVNMTLLRKTASEKAQTGAILRVIRALLGIKGTYLLQELKKPFAVPTVTFSPDYSDATVRQAMLQQGMNSMGSLFGAAATPQATLPFASEAFSDSFNPEENLDNPAFASDITDDETDYTENFQQMSSGQEENWFDGEMPPQEAEPEEKAPAGYRCENCGKEISENVYQYSIEKFGKPLCIGCQRGGRA